MKKQILVIDGALIEVYNKKSMGRPLVDDEFPSGIFLMMSDKWQQPKSIIIYAEKIATLSFCLIEFRKQFHI